MKNLTAILSALLLLFMFSCGGGSTSSEEKASQDSQDNTTANIYSADGLSIELNSDWQGKKGPKNHKLWGYAMESSGDIYTDLKDPYSEDLDELKEVTVDGLPALTVKRKFMQNESKIARKWFIYNGIDVFEFSVEAPEADFDDNLAQGLIKDLKIANRTETVVLPTEKQGKFAKPASFPTEKAEEFADIFADEAVLSDEVLANTTKALSALYDLDTNDPNEQVEENVKLDFLDSLANANGLENWGQTEKVIRVTSLSLLVIVSLTEMQKANGGDVLSNDMVTSFISQGGMSLDDLHYIYKNWDKANKFVARLEGNK